jgi:Xaa-Pro aminopeptidase
VLGTATRKQKENFTRVLKGHIALARLIFPYGTTGTQIDAFGRYALWEVGLDYAHGTGHGVGSVLNIHEGPQSISKRSNAVELRAGMIVSNEPGYYKAGEYGLRLENLMVVVPIDIPEGEHPMLGFQTLTLAPIDLNLIDFSLLTTKEIDWLNTYHQRVYEQIIPFLQDEAARKWLYENTLPHNYEE